MARKFKQELLAGSAPGGRKPRARTPAEAAAIAEAKAILRARRSLPGFVEYVLRDNNGNPVTPAEHQVSWWKHLLYSCSIKKIATILAPMGHAKTQWMAVALPLFLLGLNPNLRIMIVSSGQETAVERMQTIGEYIENSPEYKKVFPRTEPDYDKGWSTLKKNVKRVGLEDGKFAVSVNASIQAYGFETRGVGGRFDVMIFDDVVDEKNSGDSEAGRATLKRICESTWLTRLEPGAIFTLDGKMISPGPIRIIIGTRYHEEDFYADPVMTNVEAYCTMIQAVSEDYSYLDTEVRGALIEPPHPVVEEYRSFEPVPLIVPPPGVAQPAAPLTFEF